VALLGEHARVEQLVLRLPAVAPCVFLEQLRVRIRALRILVEVPHVRVRGRAVEVEVVFLDVLAVVALMAREPEQALLEGGVAAVPQRRREAEALVVVRDAGETVLAPAGGARPGVLVWEGFRRRAPRP